MNKPVKAFLNILRVELQDLEEDLLQLVEDAREKHDCEKITHYVYLENLAVIRCEIFGVNGIAKRFNEMDPDAFEDLDHLIESLKSEMLNEKSRDLLPDGVLRMVDRKMEKVKDYIIKETL